MAKKVVGLIKLQVPAGKANPSPPIGPALGQRGLNIMEFCKAFNAQTQKVEPGLPLPCVITAYADKSFTFIIKTPPTTVLIKNGVAVAHIAPGAPDGIAASEALERWRLTPHLGADEAAAMARDVAAGRKRLRPVRSPWE